MMERQETKARERDSERHRVRECESESGTELVSYRTCAQAEAEPRGLDQKLLYLRQMICMGMCCSPCWQFICELRHSKLTAATSEVGKDCAWWLVDLVQGEDSHETDHHGCGDPTP